MTTENLSISLTEKQIQNRLDYAQDNLEINIEDSLKNIEDILKAANSNYFGGENMKKMILKIGCSQYEKITNNYEEKFGFTSPKLQKKYETMLPQINKFLEKD